MSKVLTAEYDDETQTLRLPERLEGVANHAQVSVIIDDTKPKKPWSHLENILTGELGESFARAIDEAYPIEPVRK